MVVYFIKLLEPLFYDILIFIIKNPPPEFVLGLYISYLGILNLWWELYKLHANISISGLKHAQEILIIDI